MDLTIYFKDGKTFTKTLTPDKVIKWHHSDNNRYLIIDDNYAKKELVEIHNQYKSDYVDRVVLSHNDSQIVVRNIIDEKYVISYMRVLSEHIQFNYREE